MNTPVFEQFTIEKRNILISSVTDLIQTPLQIFRRKIVNTGVGLQAVSSVHKYEHDWHDWILAEARGHLQLKLVRDHLEVSPQHAATYGDDINQLC